MSILTRFGLLCGIFLQVSGNAILTSSYTKVSKTGSGSAEDQGRSYNGQQRIWTPSPDIQKQRVYVVKARPAANRGYVEDFPNKGEVLEERFNSRPFFGFSDDSKSKPTTKPEYYPIYNAASSNEDRPSVAKPPSSNDFVYSNPPSYDSPYNSYNPPPSKPSPVYEKPPVVYKPPPSQESDEKPPIVYKPPAMQGAKKPNNGGTSKKPMMPQDYGPPMDKPSSDDIITYNTPQPPPNMAKEKPQSYLPPMNGGPKPPEDEMTYDTPPPDYTYQENDHDHDHNHDHDHDHDHDHGHDHDHDHDHGHDHDYDPGYSNNHSDGDDDDMNYEPPKPTKPPKPSKPKPKPMQPPVMMADHNENGTPFKYPFLLDHVPYGHFNDYVYDHHPHIYHEVTTTTTTTTTPKPQEERLNKRPYSYYYLGRKLWYIPLYFSVYFICYIFALILKSIARHKIAFNQYFEQDRQSRQLSNVDEITERVISNINDAYKKYMM